MANLFVINLIFNVSPKFHSTELLLHWCGSAVSLGTLGCNRPNDGNPPLPIQHKVSNQSNPEWDRLATQQREDLPNQTKNMPAPIRKIALKLLLEAHDRKDYAERNSLIAQYVQKTKSLDDELERIDTTPERRHEILSKLFYEGPLGLPSKNHIGYNLFLDFNKLDSAFSPADLAQLKNQKTPPDVAGKNVHAWVRKNYKAETKDSTFPEDQAEPVDVLKWASGKINTKTLCRHHTSIILAILRHYGFNGSVGAGWVKAEEETPDPNHVWIEIDSKNLVLDATASSEPVFRPNYYRYHLTRALDKTGKIRSAEDLESEFRK